MSIHKRAKDMGVSDLVKRLEKLEEENKKLKSDLVFERTMLDNVRAEYKSSQNVIKKLNIEVASLEGEIKGLNYTIEKLKEEIKEIEKNQEYRYHRCMVAERGGEDNS